jgi:hypothetical protein
MSEAKKETKYDVAREFNDGVAAAILVRPRLRSASDHWLSGYDVGYGLRKEKNERLNEYLVSIGERPMGVLKLCKGDNA